MYKNPTDWANEVSNALMVLVDKKRGINLKITNISVNNF